MTLSVQFITMAAMILAGMGFGIMLDTYQRFLNRPKRSGWIAFINDILFWAVQALLIFYVLFMVNKGEIRFYIFIALLCGFAAYQALFKRAWLWLLEKFIQAALLTWRFFAKMVSLLVFRPITGLFQLLIGLALLVMKLLLSLARFLLKMIHSIVRLVIFWPLQKIILLFWKVLPKGIKKPIKTLYNGGARLFQKIKNVYKKARTWNKKKD